MKTVGFLLLFLVLSGNALAGEGNDSCVLVRNGDNLWKISSVLRVPVRDLAVNNGIKNPNRIHPGQRICRGNHEELDGKPAEVAEGYTPYAEAGRNPLVRKVYSD